jgi:hypothetical protein
LTAPDLKDDKKWDTHIDYSQTNGNNKDQPAEAWAIIVAAGFLTDQDVEHKLQEVTEKARPVVCKFPAIMSIKEYNS